ncbi:unnamed protein product [Ascophyllum nodosum]
MTFSRIAMMTAIGASVLCSTGDALKIVAPSEGMTVVANEPYSVGWTGASNDDVFEIDLYFCGSYSFCFEQDDDCGFFIADLCGEAGSDCVQEDGTAEVVMPEPIAAYAGDGGGLRTSQGGYRVRIQEVGTETFRCSADFYLMSSDDAAVLGTDGGASLDVVAPNANSMAVAGEEYTVEFDYDNGFGDRVGRFKIDLYISGGDGDCGTWVTSVCDKPERGCHDTQGDYNVIIPATTAAGFYVIRVGLFGEDSVYGCSEPFEVVAPGDELWN